MINFVKVLKKNPNGVLASRNGDQLATRIFQFLFAEGNKIYFCTSSEKRVYSQLVQHPYASFCVFSVDYDPVMSVNGKVVFESDLALKKRAQDENPGIKERYQAPENPKFTLLYINAQEIETFSFKEGPKYYSL
jgi:uncharacterized pyridoxamine 5'-phosphate oxidase family protein